MKTLIAAMICLAAAPALATDTQTDHNEVVVRSLAVKERLQTIELINVTAEKPAAEHAEPIDALLQEILDEAEALESAGQPDA